MAEVTGTTNLWISNGPPESPIVITSGGTLTAGQPGTGNQGAADFGTNTGFRFLQLRAGGTTSGSGVNPTAQDLGSFIVNPSAWDATAAAPGGLPADRFIAAQTITVQGEVNSSAVGGGGIGMRAILHKRDTAGVCTQIAYGDVSGINNGVPGIVAFSIPVSVPGTAFAPGETLGLTLWVYTNGIAITGQTITLRRGAGTASVGPLDTKIIPRGAGWRYRYTRSVAASASSTAALTRQVQLAAKVATASTAATTAWALTLLRQFAATSTASATWGRALVMSRSFIASSIASATRRPLMILLRPFTASSTSTATRRPFVIALRPFVATSTQAGTIAKLLFKYALGTSAATATWGRALLFARAFTATTSSLGRMAVLIPQAVLNRIVAGAASVIRRTFLFDD